MKKQTSKSTKAIEAKKLKKELELKLQEVFSATVSNYGKAKKVAAIIEKFAKKLAKKIELEQVKLAVGPIEDSKSYANGTKKVTKATTKPAKK
ncbi:hypothetical protein ACVWYG_003686 [Pedobacter sp. UYEF25]